MKHNVSLPGTIGLYVALFLAALTDPPATVAEESGKSAQDTIAVSHILDGKKFIGPTGEKGKKVHHEDVLRAVPIPPQSRRIPFIFMLSRLARPMERWCGMEH